MLSLNPGDINQCIVKWNSIPTVSIVLFTNTSVCIGFANIPEQEKQLEIYRTGNIQINIICTKNY